MAIVGWLARTVEVDSGLVRGCPQVEPPPRECAPVINEQVLRRAPLHGQPVQGSDNMLAGQPLAHFTMVSASLLKTPTMISVRNLVPSASWSAPKSLRHASLGRVGLTFA